MRLVPRRVPFTLALVLVCAAAWGQASAVEVEKVAYDRYLAPGKLTVVASFDGSKALDRWQDILDFAHQSGVKFTFFISSVYFVPDARRHQYVYPINPAQSGISVIGFGGTTDEVNRRIAFVDQALADGHDVQSHLNGHFDGSRWTEAMWRQEFDQFSALCPFLKTPVNHVRFPLLAMNAAALPALAENGILSVTSVYGKDFHLFSRVTFPYLEGRYTVVEFPISYERENGATILMMDYNFYLYDQKYHVKMAQAEQEMAKLYLDEAEKCFQERRPFFISHHFSNWNHAAYWNAMKAVIAEINKRYSVEYLTVSELYRAVSS